MSPTEIAELNVPMLSAALVRRDFRRPFVRLFRACTSGRTRRPHRQISQQPTAHAPNGAADPADRAVERLTDPGRRGDIGQQP
jgi:hypothetical protein